MNLPEHERIERNVRHTAGLHALKEISDIVQDDLREEAARVKLLRVFLRFGWIFLLLVAVLLVRYIGAI